MIRYPSEELYQVSELSVGLGKLMQNRKRFKGLKKKTDFVLRVRRLS